MKMATWSCSVVCATIVQNTPFINSKPGLLDLEDCERLGQYFLKTLTELKHNGAVEKTGFSFQVICECLLLNPDQQFCRLPESWMEYFFNRIKQSDQSWNDIIRRSGGVPYGLTAIFQSEPKSSPKVLLPHGLKTLLSIGNEKQQFEPWTRVHVFHIIRHIFNDKQLALDGANLISDGFKMCVCALSDDNWEVRNAASLCFATFLTRMVGYKNKIGSGASQKPISVFEFFFRYPDQLDFLLKELKDAGEVLQDARSPVPPSLGPILLLLARLVPAVQAPVLTKAMPDPTVLIPVIQKCLEVPHFAVRRLAVDALVTLIFKDKVIEYIQQIMSNVNPVSNNSLHGKMLVVRRLLTVHKDLKSEVIQSGLLDKFKGSLWVFSYKEEDWMLEQDPELRTMLLKTVYPLLLDDPVDLQQDPTSILFLKSCVWFVFQNGLPSRSEVETLLNHSFYEVQLEALKLIVQTLKQGSLSTSQVSWIQPLLYDQLKRNTIPKAKAKCLKGLLELFKLDRRHMDTTSCWDVLSECCMNGKLLKIRERSLLCMGCMIRKLIESEQRFEDNLKVLQSFVELVADSSRYNEPLSTRLTSIESLEVSHLFQVHPSNASDNICAILLKCWELLFHFLEDEDVNIRRKGAAIIESLQGKSIVPTHHISLIQKDFFQMLRDRFQSKEGCANLLIDWMVDYKAAVSEGDSSGTCSRLFDKEEDNCHEEVLLRSQLAASALLGIQMEGSFVHEQLQRLVKQLEQHISFLQESRSQVTWPAITTHKADVFIASYRMLLGVWILLRNGHIEESWINHVSSLLAGLEELQLHPLIKRMVEEVKGVISGSLVAGHNGYKDSLLDSDWLFLI